jgi:hypothetical protein
MHVGAGIALMGGSLACVAVAVWVVRPRARSVTFVVVLAFAGAGLGVGALLVQEVVGVASWILTPALVAVMTIAHTMALVANDGPFRT